jgi:hypothetical protein
MLTMGFSQEHQKVDFSQLDRSGMQTDLLLTHVKPFTVLVDNERKHFSMYNFSESYKELAESDLLNRFPKSAQINQKLQPTIYNSTIPIGLIHTKYELVSKDAYDKGWVVIEDNKMIKDSNHYIFDQYSQTIISPLTKRKKGLNTTFEINSDFFVNTTDNNITQIEADFGNGYGFQNITIGSEVNVKYQTNGKKELIFRIHFTNGEIAERTSLINLDYSNEDLFELFGLEVDTITSSYIPDLSIYGDNSTAPGGCEYQIFLSSDSILDKPIFVVDGFDPGDSRGILSVYNMLSYTNSTGDTLNMGDYVRQEAGHDIVVVNFPIYTNINGDTIDGGADYIERNALALVSVIEEVNNLKVGNKENVLIGPSMGGLITRYALRYMEMNNLNHDARLWVSFDSPHNGANVAMYLQYLVNYLGYGYPDIDELKATVNGLLRSKAAQQMLVDHLDAHGNSMPLTPHGAPGYHNEFQHRLDSIGYPQETRNVSMINGSGIRNIFPDIDGNAVYPDYTVMEGDIDAGTVLGIVNTRLKIKAKFMPSAGQTSEILNARAQTQALFWITVDTYTADAEQDLSSDGADTAPGGLFDVIGLLNDFEIGPEYEDLLQDAFSNVNAGVFNFIPVTSSMALNNQPDYYYQFNLGAGDIPWDDTLITNPETPFVNWYMPDDNQAHCMLTPDNVAFALCEIIEPDYELTVTTPDEIEICQGQSFNTNINFQVTLGCFQIAHFEVTGNPTGSIADLNNSELTQDGTLTLHCENFPPGNYTLFVTPNGETDKAVEITVIVNETLSDLTGTTEYSLDGETTYYQADSLIVDEGADINLKLPIDLNVGTVEWFDPSGISWGSQPLIEDIQFQSIEDGVWTVIITSISNCNVFNVPTSIDFKVIVKNPLSIKEYGMDNITVYPNPIQDVFTIDGITNKGSIHVKIFDYNGQLVKSKTYNSKESITFDMQNFSSGNYQIIIEMEGKTILKEIIKL